MKVLFLYLMALFYIGAGINHFIYAEGYIRIMPPWLGWKPGLVYISGLIEIVLGLLLLKRNTRILAAWGIIALLVIVFPANIQMMLNAWHLQQPSLWITIVRLPVQVLLIWWAYLYTKPNYLNPA